MGVPQATEFMNETLNFWKDRTDRPLTNEDARQMIESISGVFTLLAEWDAKEKSDEAIMKNDSVSLMPGKNGG
jgi:hypothetical protein